MTADSRLSRAVPFPLLGPDMLLRFTWGDLIALQTAFPTDDGMWVASIERRLRGVDTTLIMEALKLAAKGPGGFDRPTGIKWDDLPFGPDQAVGPLADALSCIITGRSFAEIQRERSAPAEEGILEMLSGRATAQAAE